MSQAAIPSKRQAWIGAMRLRTLPLAIAGIGMGSFLAAADGVFDAGVTALAILTATFLQILSNLANDYGDSVHGADSAERVGPSRAVQAGLITKAEMRQGMLVAAILSMVSGVGLVWLALGADGLLLVLLFIALGAAAIWAAVNYTAGNNPYGYAGFGDLFVFLFFGLAGVLGAYFLQAGALNPSTILPAASVGLFAVAVLNVNNIRDMESDVKAGKNSIPVRIGWENARRYHWSLLLIGLLCAVAYVAVNWQSAWQILFLVAAPLIVKNGRAVATLPRDQLDPLLKQMVLASLLFVITFGIGQVLAAG